MWGPLALAGGAAVGRALMQNMPSHVCTQESGSIRQPYAVRKKHPEFPSPNPLVFFFSYMYAQNIIIALFNKWNNSRLSVTYRRLSSSVIVCAQLVLSED